MKYNVIGFKLIDPRTIDHGLCECLLDIRPTHKFVTVLCPFIMVFVNQLSQINRRGSIVVGSPVALPMSYM